MYVDGTILGFGLPLFGICYVDHPINNNVFVGYIIGWRWITLDCIHEEHARKQLNKGIASNNIDLHCLAQLVKVSLMASFTKVLLRVDENFPRGISLSIDSIWMTKAMSRHMYKTMLALFKSRVGVLG